MIANCKTRDFLSHFRILREKLLSNKEFPNLSLTIRENQTTRIFSIPWHAICHDSNSRECRECTSSTACAATVLAPIFTWALTTVYAPYDAPLTRFSNSALAVPLFFSLFLSFHIARLLSNEGQQPSVAPGCAHGIEPFSVRQCIFVQFRNPISTKLYLIF